MEIYVLVETKKPVIFKIFTYLSYIVGAISLFFALVYFFFLPITLLAFAVGYFLQTRNYEYEYSYFDGEVRFARINNKSSRKKLPGYKMDEVMMIAPSGDASVSHYEKDPRAKLRRMASGHPDRKVYVMAAKGANGTELVYFEPDERYLDEVCKKYGQKVRR